MDDRRVFSDLLRQLEAEHQRILTDNARYRSQSNDDGHMQTSTSDSLQAAVRACDWNRAARELSAVCGVSMGPELGQVLLSAHAASGAAAAPPSDRGGGTLGAAAIGQDRVACLSRAACFKGLKVSSHSSLSLSTQGCTEASVVISPGSEVTDSCSDGEHSKAVHAPSSSQSDRRHSVVSTGSDPPGQVSRQVTFGKRSSTRQFIAQAISEQPATVLVDTPPSTRTRVVNALGVLEKHPAFELVLGIVILLNAITLGAQSEIELTGEVPQWMTDIESVFLVIYLCEILVRLAANGRGAFRNGWFLFDLSLVLMGCAYSWVLEPTMSTDNGLFQQVLLLRAVRLLRLLRALQRFSILRDAWRLLFGLLTSGRTIISTLALLSLMLYMFACVGLEVITKDEALAKNDDAQEYFGSIFVAMLTLIQFVTLDGVADVYVPLIKAKPSLCIYFIAVILIVSIALMNLVTAVLVERALEQAYADREQKQNQMSAEIKRLTPAFRRLFRFLDEDGSGTLELGEIEKLTDLDIPELQEALAGVDVSSVQELFQVLDTDGSGCITEGDFVEGLVSFCTAEFSSVPLETVMMLKLMRVTTKKVSIVEGCAARLQLEQNDLRLTLEALVSQLTSSMWYLASNPGPEVRQL